MAEFRFPNETDEYRARRNELLELEIALRAQTEAVAQKRRELPLGGRLEENYRFEQIDADGSVREIPFDALFGDHASLILYSMMFSDDWDAPCPSCTSIVDGIDSCSHSVEATTAIGVVAGAGAEKCRDWAERRGWNINLVSGKNNGYLIDYRGYADTTDPGLVSLMNVFRKTPEGIFHTWGSELVSHPMDNGHPRHVDSVWPLWNLLDLTPEGRGDAMIPKQNFTHREFSKQVLGESD